MPYKRTVYGAPIIMWHAEVSELGCRDITCMVSLSTNNWGAPGVAYNAPDHMQYKAMMLSDVPNLFFAMGYTNASWTLKADLTSAYVCRMINHCAANGIAGFCPRRDPAVSANRDTVHQPRTEARPQSGLTRGGFA